MGSYLTSIDQERRQLPQQEFFCKYSLSKLREHHARFKALCDTFSVDDSEFTQIFGQHLQVFELLDDDSNLLIDGLELFAGLVLFSGSHFESKMQFLFDLFDFNAFNSLSITDIEFLVLSCCTATHKILGLKTPINEQIIRDLIAREFVAERRVNISEMMQWASHFHEVRCFFELINRKSPKVQTLFSQKLYYPANSVVAKVGVPFINCKCSTEATRQYDQWTEGLSRRLVELDSTQSEPFRNSQVSIELDWAYGIRCLDVKKPFLYSKVHGREALIYATARIVVLAFIKINRQAHYTTHESEIISLCEWNGLIASGELADNPVIHLWKADTQRTKKVLRGCHKRGIYLLKFASEGKLLFSCGLQPQPAIVVHRVETGEVLFSTFSAHLLTEITGVTSFIHDDKNEYQTILFNLRNVSCLKGSEEGEFHSSSLFSIGPLANITCGIALKYNRNNRYLKSYQDQNESVCAVLTGHENGELYHWEQGLDEYRKQLLKTYPAEVVQVQSFNDLVLVASFSSYLDIWSIEFKLLRTIDTTALGLKLFNYEIVQFVPTEKQQIVVMTHGGDVVRLANFEAAKDQIKTTRIGSIVKLPGSLRCVSLLEKDDARTVYVGGSDGVIYGLNTSTHELADTWNINEPITAMDVCSSAKGGCLIVASTERNRIYMRVDWEEVEKQYECAKTINDLKMIGHGSTVLAACEDRYLYVLTNNSRNYFSNSKRIDLESSTPRSIFVMEQKVLVATDDNKTFLVSLSDFKYKLLDDKNDNGGLLKSLSARLRYSFKTEKKNYQLPVACTPKILLMASPEGWLHYSRDKDTLASKVVGCFGHLSSVASDIVITPDLRFALVAGSSDRTLLNYRLTLGNQKRLLEVPRTTTKQTSAYDEMLTRQIFYCLYTNNSLNMLHDQHMLVRGIKNPTLAKLLRGMMDDWKESSKLVSKHSPPVSLSLDYIYGIQTFQRRDSVFYVNNPKRFLYYIAKVAVLYNPQSNSQQFYQGHRARITCLSLLGQTRVASGEAAYYPCIRVWDHDSLQTIRVIQTGHRWGITHITSQHGFVLSCGIEDKIIESEDREVLTFSLQIANSETGQLLAYQKTGIQPIYSLRFDTLDDSKFVTTGDNNVTFWQVKSLGIQRTAVCTSDEEVITTCQTFTYNVGGKNCCEMLVGARSGNIYLLTTTKRLLLMRKKAHTKSINCIRLAKPELFVTTGEDEYLRVWNGKFDCVYEQEMRRIDFFREIAKLNSENKYFEKASVERNLSAQSVSVWHNQQPSELCMLLATRNGQVMEVTINDLCTESKYNLYMRNHCSQLGGQQPHKRLFFTLHPRFDILLSLGEDQNLFLWDTEKNKIITSKVLGYVAHPTCAKFNRDGDIIVVGFSDGLVIFLDSKIIKSNQGKNDEKYIIPTLSLVQKHKQERKAAVLNIEFSESGEHLAVSFNSSHSDRARYDPSIPNDPSFISLFINRTKDKTKSLGKGIQHDKLYSWFTDVRCQQGQKTYHTQYGSISSMACYFMSFAESQGRTYLLIYYQLVDGNNIRLNHNTQSDYIVWDVNTSTIVVNLELISGMQWKRLNVPNSIGCRYQLYNELARRKAMDAPRNNNLIKPEITSMFAGRYKYMGDPEPSNILFMGTLNGDLHVAWAKSIDYGDNSNYAPKEDEMYLARSYTAHDSFVDHLEVSTGNNESTAWQYIYSNGIDDQSVTKWRINYEPTATFIEEGEDIFGDVLSEDELQQLGQGYRKRQLLTDLKSYNHGLYRNHHKQPLKMKAIIGRGASRARNNLFFDCQGEAVYPVGCNIVMLEPKSSKQGILFSIEGQFNCADRISTMVMAGNRRIIAAGTQGKMSSITLWEVRSKLCLRRIDLPELESVLKLAFSDDFDYLLVYGLDHEHFGVLYVLGLREQEILGVMKMKYQTAWAIKSLQFLPGTFEEFVTCGVNEYSCWYLRGAELNYKRLAIKDERQVQKQLVLFNVVMLAGHGYAMCCDSGYLYLMSFQHKLLFKAKGHDGWCLSLSWQASTNRLISGGRDGKVVVWKVQNSILVEINKCLLAEQLPRPVDSKSQSFKEIESVDLHGNSVLVGIRNGSIFVLALDPIETRFAKDAVVTSLAFHDLDATKGMFFSDDQHSLYEITQNGLLSIWNLTALKCVASHHFNKTVVDMLSCNRQEVFFVAFEKEIIAVSKIDPTFKPIEDFKAEFRSRIQSVALSANHKIMAISVEKSQDRQARVCVYDIATTMGFKLLFQTYLVQSPQYIDFSSSNRMLLCKNSDKDLLVDLNTWAVSASHHEDLQWTHQGVKQLIRLNSITKLYSQEPGNRINKVVELFDDFYAFTDAVGTIRVFYKAKEESPAELMSFNMQHLNEINLCVKSRRSTLLASSSVEDRSIIIWQIDQKFK